jgi:hypothetical protein
VEAVVEQRKQKESQLQTELEKVWYEGPATDSVL